jgi:hypothetical protein
MFVKAITGDFPEQYPRSYQIKDQFGEDVDLLHIDPLDAEFCRRIVEEIYK